MPWSEKQRRAIFLRIKSDKGEDAARRFMREHNGKGGGLREVMGDQRKRHAKARAGRAGAAGRRR